MPPLDRSPSVSPRVDDALDGAPTSFGDCRASNFSPARRADRESSSLADRGRLSVRASCVGPCCELSLACLVALRQRAIRPRGSCRAPSAIADNPSDTFCRPASAFRLRPRHDRFSPPRVNVESFFGPRCLPSTNASLIRVACAARARIRPPPRRGLATASRLPAPSFRRRLPLSRSAPADTHPRYSEVGLPVPLRLADLSIRAAWQGGGASFVDFCNHVFPIREHHRRIVRSPPVR